MKSTLDKMYNGEDYPEKFLITLGIIERLQGKEAARKYLFEHLELDKFREIAVKNAMTDRDFTLAERLCKEALMKKDSGYYGKPSQFFYLLEQIYESTNNTADLIATRRAVLQKGDITYFRKVKSLYEQLELWDREKEALWSELPRKIGIHYYTVSIVDRSQYPNMSKIKSLEAWLEAKKKYHLSDTQIQMARELGMNPKKFGKLVNHKQEPWKLSLPLFIEECYFKSFGRKKPELVKPLKN